MQQSVTYCIINGVHNVNYASLITPENYNVCTYMFSFILYAVKKFQNMKFSPLKWKCWSALAIAPS